LRPLALSFLLAGVGAARVAAAEPSARECIASSESSIALRKETKLNAARDELLKCAAPACPDDIRVECERRLLAVNAAIPTLVLEAADSSGADIVAVTVTMDGVPLAHPIGGEAIAVDPGPHRFVLETSGHPKVEKTIVLREGEKDRRERIVFEVAKKATPPALVHDPTRRILGIVTAGAGLAGLAVGTIFGARASSLWSTSQTECQSPSDCSNHTQAVSDHDDAQVAATISTVAFATGGALIAIGGILFFTAPYVTVGPTASAGLRLQGTF
jgi:hypothetical protein